MEKQLKRNIGNKTNDTRRRKPFAVTLTKRFEGDNFKLAMEELATVDVINRILSIPVEDSDETKLPEDLVAANDSLITYFYNNTPDLLGKRNIHTSLNMSSNKAQLRTEEGIGFGWYVGYVVEDKHAMIEFVEINVIVYNDDKEFIESMLDNGWEKPVPKFNNRR